MKRVDMHRLQELVRLHRMGTLPRAVARMLKMSPNTERRYRHALEAAQLLAGAADELPELEVLKRAVEAHAAFRPAIQHKSSVDKWAAKIEAMVDEGTKPKAIYDRLKVEDKEFRGSLSAIKRLCARQKNAKGITANDVAIPVVTRAGHTAQVDFGSIGRLWDPIEQRERKAYVFVMVLAHSRHQFSKIVFDQKITTWLQLHVEAFTKFGGVPEVIVPDNLKAAVVRAAFGNDGTTVLNRSYRELARHYGFMVDPTPVRSPEKKGIVEAGVKYVKRNFFQAWKDERDAGVLQELLDRWVVEIAGQRIHGTTQRRPLVVFEQEERAVLQALPTTPWKAVWWREPKLHRDCHALVEKGLYSAPWRLVGKHLLARVTEHSVELYFDDARVATHPRVPPGKRSTLDHHLPEGRRDYRHRTREHWMERAAELGDEVAHYITEVFDSDDVLYQLRTVQAIVTHLEGFPVERARAACARASYYGNYRYGGIKQILKKALDREPLPNVVLPARGGPEKPRFARDVRELLQLPLENTHAPN